MRRVFSIVLVAIMLMSSMVVIPVSAEKTAPSGQIWEGESGLRLNCATSGAHAAFPYTQDVSGYNNNEVSPIKPSCGLQLLMKPTEVGSSVTFTLDVKCEGEKTLYASFLKAGDFGTFDIYLGDEKLTSFDGYCKKADRCFVELELGKHDVNVGDRLELTFVITGKNASSTGYLIAVDFVELVGDDGVRRTQRITDERENYIYGVKNECDGALRLEGEALTLTDETLEKYVDQADGSPYHYTYQAYIKNGADLSFGKHLFFIKNALSKDDSFSAYFYVNETGTYDVTYNGMGAADYGQLTWAIDGVEIGGLDLYAPSIQHFQSVGSGIELEKGRHTLTVTCAGKNDLSTGYAISLDCIDLKAVDPAPFTGSDDTAFIVSSVLAAVSAAAVAVVSFLIRKERLKCGKKELCNKI